MRTRSNMHAEGALKVKAFYTIADLAEAAGITWFVMQRLLRAKQVQFTRSGRSILISVEEIRSRAPAIWNALVTTQALRREAEERFKASARRSAEDDEE